MTYAPSRIYGPIIPNSSASATNLPGVTQTTFTGSAVVSSTGIPKELYTRAVGSSNLSGNTADYVGHIFLNNDFYANLVNIISGFIPDYYIDVFKTVQTTMTGVTGSLVLPGGALTQNDRYEVISYAYTRQSFLTNLSGATALAITGIDVQHKIYAGNTTINADYIFYRKIGRLST
jgi:hypothetical protein